MQPSPIDVERLLRFFQDLYAHSLAVNEILRNYEVDVDPYPALKAKYDKQAAQQFDLFYRALNDPKGFGDAVRAFLNNAPKQVQ